MLATTLIESLFLRGIRVWTDVENIKAAPASDLTDEDRHLIKSYKTELLWRIGHPAGDPDASGYAAGVFIDGERVRIPLDQLIAEGKEIIEREGLKPKTPGLDPDLRAASVALSRFDEAHREWAAQAPITEQELIAA